MPDKPPLTIGFNVPFHEAIAAAQLRGVVLPDVYYGELQGIARQLAFSIAGIASLDQLQAVKDSLSDYMEKGGSFKSWKRQSAQLNLELPSHRLDNIWRTNLQGNYMRGKWEQFQRNADTRPYLLYDAINDSRVRPSHLAHDGTIRRVNDAFWKTHSPPLGYRCRCSLISLSEEQAQARSRPNPDGEGTGLYKTPQLEGGIPAEPDKGWDYNPFEDRMQWVNQALERFDPKLRAVGEIITQPVKYWEAETPQSIWHDAAFSESPIEFKRAIRAHDEKLAGIKPYTPKEGAHYWRVDQRIHMVDLTPEQYRNQGTWRHEYGHFLDHQTGPGGYVYRSSLDDFTSLMRKETKELVTASGYGTKGAKTNAIIASRKTAMEQARDAVVDLDKSERMVYLNDRAKTIGLEFDDIARYMADETVHDPMSLAGQARANMMIDAIHRRDPLGFMEALEGGLTWKETKKHYLDGLIGNFSDLVGSASKNKILGYGPAGNGGHPTGYLKEAGKSQTEVFANLTSLLGSNSQFWRQVTRVFYPRLSELYMSIISNVTN